MFPLFPPSPAPIFLMLPSQNPSDEQCKVSLLSISRHGSASFQSLPLHLLYALSLSFLKSLSIKWHFEHTVVKF